MSKRLQSRYYGVFAVNPNDPSDFYGYCEDSFSMSWCRDHVCMWRANNNKQYKKTHSVDSHHPSQAQFDWNWAKNYPKAIPHGYVLKIFRLGSKHCPYKIDTSYRLNAKRYDVPWRKWMFKNPKCKFNGIFADDGWKTWINEAVFRCKSRMDAVAGRVDMDKVSTQDLKRHNAHKKHS